MKKLESTIKNRFVLFISLIIFVVVLSLGYVQKSITEQKNIAFLLEQSGEQILLSRTILENAKNLVNNPPKATLTQNTNTLQTELKTFQTNQNSIFQTCEKHEKGRASGRAQTIDSLFKIANSNCERIVSISKEIISNTTSNEFRLNDLQTAENQYVLAMESLLSDHHVESKNKIVALNQTIIILTILACLFVISGFLFILVPSYKKLFKRGRELSRLKTELEIKDTYNKIFIEQAPTSIAMLDKNMVYMAVSQKWIHDYKKEGEQIVGRSHYDVFPEINDEWKQKHQNCLQGDIDVCPEAEFIREDGTVQWIFWDVRPWYESDGTIGGLIMYTGDITKEKQQRLEKEHVEEMLQQIYKIAGIGTWELDLLTDNYKINDIGREIMKFPMDYQPVGENTLNFVKEEYRDLHDHVFNKLLMSGTPYDFELEFLTYEGDEIWVRDIGLADFVDGKCTRLYGFFQDISAFKATENELIQKNNMLNFAEEIANLGHFRWDVINNKTKWSKNLYNILGYDDSVGEGSFELLFKVVHPDDRDIVEQRREKTFREKKFGNNFVYRIVTPNGELKTLKVSGVVFTNEKGQIKELVGTCQDITEQQMAEAKFQGLLESAPDAMVIVNDRGEIQIVNKQAEKLFGYKPSEILNKPVEVLIPSQYIGHHSKLRNGYFKQPAERQILQSKELSGVNKMGKEFPIQISLSPLRTKDGLLVSAAIRDITRQKKTEQEILKKNEMLSFAEDLAKMGSWEIYLSSNKVNWSDGMFEILDLKDTNIQITPEFYYSFIHPDDLELALSHYEGMIQARQFTEIMEHRVITNDGKVKILQSKGEAIKNKAGDIVLIKGTSQDVTKQKAIEKEITQKNEMLTFAEDLAKMGSWEMNVTTNTINWSDGMYDILDLEDHNIDVTVEFYNSFVHPDDLVKVLHHHKLMAEGKRFGHIIEHRVVTYKGKVKHINSRGEAIFDNKGNVTSIKGTSQDVTKEKAIETEITQKNELLVVAEDIAMMGHWLWDIANDKITWSRGMYKILEAEAFSEPLTTQHFVNFVHPEDVKKVEQQINDMVVNKDFGEKFTNRVITTTGKIKTISILGEVKIGKLGEVVEIVGTIQDITKDKEKEEELVQKNEILNYAENLAMMGHWQWDFVKGKIFWSDGIYKMLNLSSELTDISFEDYFKMVHPEDKDKVATHLEHTIKFKDFGDTLVHRMITKQGEIKTLHLLGEVLLNSEGEIEGLKGTCQDVTKQKEEEAAILHKNEMLNYAENLAMMGHWLWNLEKGEIFWSDGMYRILEIQDAIENLSADYYFNFVHPDDKEKVENHLKKILRNKVYGNVLVHKLVSKTGKIKIIHSNGEVVTNENGKIILIKGTCQDVTKQKQEESRILKSKRNLEVLAEKLTKQNTQLADFAQITSHNLRAPVSNLNSLLDLYALSENPEEKEVVFVKFEKVINHLTHTLNTLVDALRTKKEVAKKQSIYFDKTLEHTKNLLMAQIAQDDVIIKSNFAAVNKILYNKQYLESIFLNLVENAIKYKSKKRRLKINIKSKIKDNNVYLVIKDNGLGIDLKRHGKKVFGLNQVFHRHPDAKGVGLFMTRMQIESMGGTISVKSTVDKGTTFIINFNNLNE